MTCTQNICNSNSNFTLIALKYPLNKLWFYYDFIYLNFPLVLLNTVSVKWIVQQKILSFRLVIWLFIRTLLMSNCAPIVLLRSAQGTNRPVTSSPSSTVCNRWFYCWRRQTTSSSWSPPQGSSGNVLLILRMLLSTLCLSGHTFFLISS